MAELEDYGIDLDTLRQMYQEYQSGAAKSQLERRYLGKSESHGKVLSCLSGGISASRQKSDHRSLRRTPDFEGY